MTPQEKTVLKGGVLIAVLILLWYYLKPAATTQQVAAESPWSLPFFQTNPGIMDAPVYNLGAPNFQANNTLNYYDGTINGLSNKFIPLFGLVGMTAVGA